MVLQGCLHDGNVNGDGGRMECDVYLSTDDGVGRGFAIVKMTSSSHTPAEVLRRLKEATAANELVVRGQRIKVSSSSNGCGGERLFAASPLIRCIHAIVPDYIQVAPGGWSEAVKQEQIRQFIQRFTMECRNPKQPW